VNVFLSSQYTNEVPEVLTRIHKIIGNPIEVNSWFYNIQYTFDSETKVEMAIFYKEPDSKFECYQTANQDVTCKNLSFTNRPVSDMIFMLYDHLLSRHQGINPLPILMVVGASGSGKSSVLSMLDGRTRNRSMADAGVTSIPEIRDFNLGETKMRIVDTPGLAEALRGTCSTSDAIKLIRLILDKTWNSCSIIMWVLRYSFRETILEETVGEEIAKLCVDNSHNLIVVLTGKDLSDENDEAKGYITNYKRRLKIESSPHEWVCSQMIKEITPSLINFTEGCHALAKAKILQMINQAHINSPDVARHIVNDMLDQVRFVTLNEYAEMHYIRVGDNSVIVNDVRVRFHFRNNKVTIELEGKEVEYKKNMIYYGKQLQIMDMNEFRGSSPPTEKREKKKKRKKKKKSGK